MYTEVMAWNVQEALALPQKMSIAVEAIKRLGSHIIVLSDAYSLQNTLHGAQLETLQEARATLHDEGWRVTETAYGPRDNWHHDRNLMMLNRGVGLHVSRALLGHRYGLVGQTTDEMAGLTVIGMHGDDRPNQSRNTQITSLLDQFVYNQGDSETAAIVVGDVNDLDPADCLSPLLGSNAFNKLAQYLPYEDLRYMALRINSMARGKAISLFKDAGLRDVDTKRRKTFPAKYPLIRPDHIFVNHLVDADNIRVGQRVEGIDHLPIQAQLHW